MTKNLSTPTGAYMLLQSAMYARIGNYTRGLLHETPLTAVPLTVGATHLSWQNTEVFRECYNEGQPYDDYVKLTFRNCQIVSRLFRPIAEQS